MYIYYFVCLYLNYKNICVPTKLVWSWVYASRLPPPNPPWIQVQPLSSRPASTAKLTNWCSRLPFSVGQAQPRSRSSNSRCSEHFWVVPKHRRHQVPAIAIYISIINHASNFVICQRALISPRHCCR